MDAPAPHAAAPPGASTEAPIVEIVIPVYNEGAMLERSIRQLCAYLDAHGVPRWKITIADNASTDATLSIAEQLAAEDGRVAAFHLTEKGRGRALKAAWLASRAEIVAYMDVDLSTNLDAFGPLIAPLLSGHSQVAIGNRLMRSSQTKRQWKREVLSRGYNLLITVGFRPGFTDAQCGFKAIRMDVARELLPKVRDTGWFFDTELLLLASRAGHRIYEVPVDWIEDLDSRVHIASTVRDDLMGLVRMRLAFFRSRTRPRARSVRPSARPVLP